MDTINATRFFAVQLTANETPNEVARLILRAAHDERLLFWTLEILDVIEVGSSSFLRLRTDIADLTTLADKVRSRGRSVILPEKGLYVLRSYNGSHGNVPMLSMHQVPKPGQQRAYKGTKQWEAQFAS